MHNDRTQSVLCVLEPSQAVISQPAIVQAQLFAREANLPLAVIVCVPTTKELPGLLGLEEQLAAHDIPLMALIGDPETRLAGATYHLKPKKLFYASEHDHPGGELVRHPVAWPGTIASVSELINTDGQAC